jgi:hypothetical protein
MLPSMKIKNGVQIQDGRQNINIFLSAIVLPNNRDFFFAKICHIEIFDHFEF